MDLRRLIGRLLAALVIAGLAAAPLVTPAAAKRSAVAEMIGMSSMSDDMPCCPDEQKSKDCQDCPLVAMCVWKTTQAASSMAAAIPMRLPIRTALRALDETLPDGLGHPPPEHPPRILV